MAESHPPLLESHPHLTEFIELLSALNKESERGVVLITASFIDQLLGRIIRAFLIESTASDALLEGFNAPLGSYSARIAAARALGLLSEVEHAEAERLRKIRNIFAHRVHVSFSDQQIRDLCANLAMAAKPYGEVTVDARGAFTTSATALIMHLTNRPHYVGLQRRSATIEWPY